MPLYDLVRDLPLEIDGTDYEGATIEISPEFTRKTTTIVMRGGGAEGRGEDVTYDPAEHDPSRFPHPTLAGLVDARLALEAPRRPRPLPGRRARGRPPTATTGAGRSSRRRSTSRSSRPAYRSVTLSDARRGR